MNLESISINKLVFYMLFAGYEFIGVARDIFIAIDACMILICFEIFAILLMRTKRTSYTFKINLGWAIIFFEMGVIGFLGTYYSFFFVSEEDPLFIFLLNVVGTILLISIIGIFEYLIKKYHNTHYIIAILGIPAVIIINIESIKNLGLIVQNVYTLVLFIFTLIFFRKLIQNSSGSIRKHLILFTMAFYMLMISNMMTTIDSLLTQESLGLNVEWISLIFRILKILSLFVMSYVILRLPVFTEVNWRENLVHILAIHRNSCVAMFGHKFIQNLIEQSQHDIESNNPPENLSDDLIAGGMVGIANMLKEILRSKQELKIVDHGDMKILMEHGKFVTIALSVKEEMMIYREKLVQLRIMIENSFEKILENWDGNLAYFEPISMMVANIFESSIK